MSAIEEHDDDLPPPLVRPFVSPLGSIEELLIAAQARAAEIRAAVS